MNRKFEEYKVRYHGNNYIIIKPLTQFDELYVCEVDAKRYILFGDRSTLEELSYHVMCIRNNPGYVLFIPTKKPNSEYLSSRWMCMKSYDLVISHHSKQLQHKLWKELRKLLFKVDIVSLESVEYGEPDYARYSFKENKDLLIAESRFDTLFLCGSGNVFDILADSASHVAEWGQESFTNYGGHAHSHLDLRLPQKIRNSRSVDVTIDFYSKELWGY